MSTNPTLILVLTTSLAAGCAVGNGHMTTETRTVPTFTAVDVDSSVEVTITIDDQAADRTDLKVSAESNLMDRVETSVAGDTLYVDLQNARSYRDIHVVGTTAELSEAWADNSAALQVWGVSTPTFDAWADNSSVLVIEGQVDSLDLYADNSAHASTADLQAQSAWVELDNSASAEICVTGTVAGIVDHSAHLTVLCGGDASGVTTHNSASVTW